MTGELVPYREQTSIDLAPAAWQLAEKIAATDFVPPAMRNKPEAVLACILAGHEAGVSPMQALSKIHVIEGRPAMSSELMRALVQRAGHSVNFEDVSSTSVTVSGKRRGEDRWTRVTWTMDDARRAGLDGKQNWRKHPRAMLIARATAELCRMLFADVLAGISYAIEELDDDAAYAPGEAPPPEPKKRATAKARRAATASSATSDPEQLPPPPAGEVPALPGDDVAEGVLEGDDAAPEAPGDDGDVIDPPEDDPEPEAERASWAPGEWESGEWESGDFPETPTPAERARLTGPQLIAIRMAELWGIKGAGEAVRARRLAVIAAIVGRPLASSKDLTGDELRQVLDRLNATAPGDPEPTLAPVPTVEDAEFSTGSAPDSPAPEPERPEAPSLPLESAQGTTAPRPAPAAKAPPKPPREWDAEHWRGFLSERKVKATALLAEARRLGAAEVRTLDDLAGLAIVDDLVGWAEDQALR